VERIAKNLMAFLMGVCIWLPSLAAQITITSWGGLYSHAQRRALADAFTQATETRVLMEEWGGGIARIEAMVRHNSYTTHALDSEGDTLVAGCESKALEPIDYQQIGVESKDLLAGSIHRCGVGHVAWSMVLVYDSAVFNSEQPANWSDFWDTSRFLGRRGLGKHVDPNLEIALIADGIAADKVYMHLKTPAGVNRAFESLSQLAPKIDWWEAGAQAPQRILDGEVTMSSAWHGRALVASTEESSNLAVVWNGQIVYYDYWVIPRDHPRKQLSYQFIKFAMSPLRQAELTRYIPYGATHLEASQHLKPAILARLPSAPKNLARWVPHDPEFWHKHGKQLAERFANWTESLR